MSPKPSSRATSSASPSRGFDKELAELEALAESLRTNPAADAATPNAEIVGGWPRSDHPKTIGRPRGRWSALCGGFLRGIPSRFGIGNGIGYVLELFDLNFSFGEDGLDLECSAHGLNKAA